MEYEDLYRGIKTIVNKVNRYSFKEIEQVIQDEMTPDRIKDDNFMQFMRRIQMDVSQDRRYCKLIGIKNYADLPESNRKRIRVFAFYVAQLIHTGEINQEVVLPLL